MEEVEGSKEREREEGDAFRRSKKTPRSPTERSREREMTGSIRKGMEEMMGKWQDEGKDGGEIEEDSGGVRGNEKEGGGVEEREGDVGKKSR